MVKIAVDCKRGQIGLVSLVVYIVVINGIWTRSSLFHPVRAFQVPMVWTASLKCARHEIAYSVLVLTPGPLSFTCFNSKPQSASDST